MQYKITVLGCGGSNGVPSIENGYGDCDPNNIKNNRTRTSLLIDIFNNNEQYSILIDVSPDFRYQALKNNIKKIDTILLTHHHSDHIYGIHELRSINRLTKKPIDFYLNQDSLNAIKQCFYYLFNNKPPLLNNGTFFKPDINFITLEDSVKNVNFISKVGSVSVDIAEQEHGKTKTLGFIIDGQVGYIPDFSSIPKVELQKYKNISVLFIATFLIKKHDSHANLDEAIAVIKEIKPKEAYLVHMGDSLDYELTLEKLQQISKETTIVIRPSYDGMVILM
jgi:phosphoribosyl 1,2-cyclic phosphate phosphodiesterase